MPGTTRAGAIRPSRRRSAPARRRNFRRSACSASRSPAIPNLTFAGDFCHGHIGLTTIESAVASGLAAAVAIAERRGLDGEIELLRPHRRPKALYPLLRYALAPYVAGAKVLSMGSERLRPVTPDPDAEESLVQYLLTPGLPPRHQRFDS